MSELKKYTILYVDDEESNLRIFKNTFRREYNILTATSGAEGLEILEKEHVDLILTDQRMPGMTGVDFLKNAIKKHPELNRILVTAYTDYEILREAVNEVKIFQYIEKPWDQDDIKGTIDNALELHRLRQENINLTSTLSENNKILNTINEDLNNEIDKHKATQAALLREKEYAENCNRLKSAFLANVSHEIRTPMNSIIGFLDLLEDETLPFSSRKDFMAIVQRSCLLLLHIIDDIVEISKIDSGNIELKCEEFSLNEMLEKVFVTMNLNANFVELTLSEKLPSDKNKLINDPVKLEQILINLIGNSLKFTIKGKVEFGAEIKDDLVLFHVKDTGIGIAQENQELIFDRFSQVETSPKKRFGGNGLGLAISKAYVEKMGGKIWVESELDKGSTFYFTLPFIATQFAP
jgi:signal transduction histidine kinase